jgi:lipopolysaccharide/colanic/teichoic acid biosynthesis glycosyltransferase
MRLVIKPGMTGWAQVNGLRGATPSVDQIARRVKMAIGAFGSTSKS